MGFELTLETPPAQKYVIWAWSFLEDAERTVGLEPKPTQRLLHIERHLRTAAIWLRSACESHFQRWDLVPDQKLMWFLTAVRHSSAHASASPSRAEARRIGLAWEMPRDEGHLIADVDLTVDLNEAERMSKQNRDAAQRFLLNHDGNLFRAIHGAVRACAEWVGVELNADFERLGKLEIGRATLRIPVRGQQTKQRILDATRIGDSFVIGDIREELPDPAKPDPADQLPPGP